MIELPFYDADEYWPDHPEVTSWDDAASDPIADMQKMYDAIIRLQSYGKEVVTHIHTHVTYWDEHIEPIINPPPPRHGPPMNPFGKRGKGVRKR